MLRQSRTHHAIRRRVTGARRAFSLVELIVVMLVTLLLASILMPALRGVQEHAERLFSASNMRQIGMGMSMYSSDNRDDLPASALILLPLTFGFTGQLRISG